MIKKEIKYSESAKITIEELSRKYIRDLEDIIVNKNSVPGDDFIEITASDLKKAARNFKIIEPQKGQVIIFIWFLYIFIGILTMIFGLFYNFFIDIYLNSPERFVLITFGFFVTIFSLFSYVRIKNKYSRENTKNEYVISNIKNLSISELKDINND